MARSRVLILMDPLGIDLGHRVLLAINCKTRYNATITHECITPRNVATIPQRDFRVTDLLDRGLSAEEDDDVYED